MFENEQDLELDLPLKTCKFCGAGDLHWQSTEDGWRLHDRRGNVHACANRDDDRRIGTFKIRRELLFDRYARNEIRKLLRDVVIIDARCDLAEDVINYTGIYWRFDVIPRGEGSKPYEIIEMIEERGSHILLRLSWNVGVGQSGQARRELEL